MTSVDILLAIEPPFFRRPVGNVRIIVFRKKNCDETCSCAKVGNALTSCNDCDVFRVMYHAVICFVK